MRITCIYFLTILFLAACSSGGEQGTDLPVQDDSYPRLLHEIWDAHGGIIPWQRHQALTFTVQSGKQAAETHHVNLNDRKVLIESDSFRLGRDDNGVWVAPAADALDRNPVFYHNLVFYFYGIPFLMADPGVNHEDAGTRSLNGKSYRALKVTFDDDVGDAPDDEYILLADPESMQMEWLLYTVTYFVNEKVTNYNALRYSDWQKTGDLVMPGKLTGYVYENDSLGNMRYEMNFSDVTFSDQPLPVERFVKPETAEYVSD